MTPEDHFRDGLSALSAARSGEAVEHFKFAMAAEKQSGTAQPQMRYLSYYGLSLALSKRSLPKAVEFCERAVVRDPFDAVLQLNLGKVYLVTGRTTKALATFERGLKLDPTNTRLKIELSRANRRRTPAIPGLGRNHVINRSLGRLRASLFTRTPH